MMCINRPIRQKGAAVVGFFLFLLLLFGIIPLPIPLPKIFVYNQSASLPIGWYLILPSKHYQTGDIVVFQAPERVENLAVQRGWLQVGEFMMKRIGALENMTYQVDENGNFYIETTYIGRAATHDHNGLPIPQLHGVFTVAPGTFLPVTDNPNSFDGRYYGIVPLSNIRYKVVKVVPFITNF